MCKLSWLANIYQIPNKRRIHFLHLILYGGRFLINLCILRDSLTNMGTQTDFSQLNERSLILFKALVEQFIDKGRPVGSRSLAKDSELNISSATIRNIMADLEELGLISSPHTSAGRVPTVKGYRLFVDTLLRVSTIAPDDVRKIKKELQYDAIESLLERTSNILSSITHLAGVVMVPRKSELILKQIEFMPLSDNRVLVILVVNNQEIQNQIIHTVKPYSSEKLREVANYLNERLIGKDLSTVRNDLVVELERMQKNVNKTMQTAIEMAQKAFKESGKEVVEDDLLLSGQTNLMGVSDLSDIDKLKKLFDSFNQKRDILHLLEQSINAGGVQIFIGDESGYDVLNNCSVVTSPYEKDGRILGVLGVIGPTRMNYERVVPIVDLTAKMLGLALNSKT